MRRRVPGFPKYKASTRGYLYKKISREWVRMRGTPHIKSGHIMVSLEKPEGGIRRAYLHQIILETFVGPCPPGKEGRHFPDGDPTNNAITNLSWGSRSRNQRDRVAQGNSNRGVRNGCAKLNERKVLKIRRLHRKGKLSLSRLASRFGVHPATIWEIVHRKIWSYI